MPWLTVIVAICLVILISLGTWQYQRLQWKTALLAEVEAAVTAPPLSSFVQVQSALDAGDPVDFRRFGTTAQTLKTETPFLVFTGANRDISWRVFTPVQDGSGTAFAGLGLIDDGARDNVSGYEAGKDVVLTGYVRLARKRERGMTKSTPEKNRWFGFNHRPKTHGWADLAGVEADMRFYIDTVPGALDASLLPAKRPEIRNNHFDYMLTWYSFALILLIIYFILHRRAGRLKFS